MNEINEKPTIKDLIERFAAIQKISIEEATQLIGGETEDEVLDKIKDFTINKINTNSKLNRAQRRALAKKAGKKGKNAAETVSDMAKKLNYIELIQKLRELNEKKENEDYVEDTTEAH